LVETEFSVPAPQPAPLDRAGNFAFSSVQPGAYAVSLSDLPDDVYLKESTPDVFAVRRGSRGSISIEIGTDGARVTGIAVDQDGMPFAGAQVTLIPASDSRTRPDRYRTTVSGPDGTFTIRGIVPGDYRAFAWHGLEPNAYLNVEYMRDYLDVGTPLHLEPRQNGTVPLRVISLGQ
jgi:hypothetical protein